MPEEPQDDIALISKHDFFFETPLYEVVNTERFEDDFFEGDVDAYSAKNQFETTYKITGYDVDDYSNRGFGNYMKVRLDCKRTNDDRLVFYIYQNDEVTVKVGQNPSIADLQFAEIGKKYDKLLERDDLQEFKKAIGLAAHGVGAGSFVYLRRIFEKLIDQTFLNSKDELSITEEDYFKKRMDEKVELLKKFLPSQLVALKKVYSILSSGVHKLSEQECLTYFPALKLSIELILDQQIEKEAKETKDKAAQKQIDDIQAVLAAKNGTKTS